MSETEKEKLVSAISEAIKGIINDEETVKKFWEGGYKELTTHASNASSQWVGKRILAAVITALFIWSMSWLVTNGKLS